MTGRVYTETLVHAAPAALVSEAPYQLAIINLLDDAPGGDVIDELTGNGPARADGPGDKTSAPSPPRPRRRVTARILAGPDGERAQIGDLVEQVSVADGVALFRRID